MLRMEPWQEPEGESSECSSGCQSGWTMYLDQSSSFPFLKPGSKFEEEDEEVEEVEEEEEEDLSMVSDASSGPPHLHEEECHQCFSYCSDSLGKAAGGKRRREEGERKQQGSQRKELSSFLDDTASSPVYSFSKVNHNAPSPAVEGVLEFSSCLSATHLKGKSAFGKQMGYLQSASSVKKTSDGLHYPPSS